MFFSEDQSRPVGDNIYRFNDKTAIILLTTAREVLSLKISTGNPKSTRVHARYNAHYHLARNKLEMDARYINRLRGVIAA